MPYIPLVLVVVLLGFLAVLLLRAVAFRPKANAKVLEQEETFDRNVTVERLQQLIRFKTVSYRDKSLEDDEEFQKLLSALPSLYPNVLKTCEYQELPDRAVLLCWKGATDGDPAVLMAHYDVVPVEEEGWDKPAFEGIIEDGV